MSRGPLYLKSVNGGKMTIGENIFFNHNCSLTCAESIVIGNHCMFANNLVMTMIMKLEKMVWVECLFQSL